jgi:hypothetical protein
VTSQQVIAALREKYPDPWVFFKELRAGTGWGKRSEQRIDVWAIHPHPSRHVERIAFEIKVCRQDFLNELKDRLKRRGALLLSNRFYFVTPVGLVSPEEIPIECGLTEIAQGSKNEKPAGEGWCRRNFARTVFWFRDVVDAPVRESVLPTWRFVASLARRIAREEAKVVNDGGCNKETLDGERRVPENEGAHGV